MSEVQGETYGEMLAKWEADKPNHHEMCLVQRGWDMSCQCAIIHRAILFDREQVVKKLTELAQEGGWYFDPDDVLPLIEKFPIGGKE